MDEIAGLPGQPLSDIGCCILNRFYDLSILLTLGTGGISPQILI